MDKNKILDNFRESRLVRFFVAFLSHNWVYGSLDYTDFDFDILSFEDFVTLVKGEIEFTIPYDKDSEERLLPFKLFLIHKNDLISMNEENYQKYIEEPGVLVFCTQDEFEGLRCLDDFKDTSDGMQFFS